MTRIVNSSAIRVTGEIFGMKTRSYHSLPLVLTRTNRVSMPARNGIPR